MFKNRIEALSDGIFAIVFTLLVIEIKVPEYLKDRNADGLWHAIFDAIPLLVGYFVSFVVLTMFWNAHSFLFNAIAKNSNRQLSTLNMVFLCFISLLPFSAHMIGRYSDINLAVMWYGFHVLILSLLLGIILRYVFQAKDIDTSHNTTRLIKQAIIRQSLTFVFTIMGIVVAYLGFANFAFVLYMFPIIFNIIPGCNIPHILDSRFSLKYNQFQTN
jgi:uncharacterized membrane protein